MNKDLKIVILGSAGSGKTTLANILSELLEREGMSNIVLDSDGSFYRDLDTHYKVLEIIKERGPIVVETMQQNRVTTLL